MLAFSGIDRSPRRWPRICGLCLLALRASTPEGGGRHQEIEVVRRSLKLPADFPHLGLLHRWTSLLRCGDRDGRTGVGAPRGTRSRRFGGALEAVGAAGNFRRGTWQPPGGAAGTPAAGPPTRGCRSGDVGGAARRLQIAERTRGPGTRFGSGPEPWDLSSSWAQRFVGTSDSFSTDAQYIDKSATFADRSQAPSTTAAAAIRTRQRPVRKHTRLANGVTNRLNYLFYDKFQVFDAQTDFDLGIGYRMVHTPELNDPRGQRHTRNLADRRATVPESLLGSGHKTPSGSRGPKIVREFNYYPEWNNSSEVRMLADAGWEIELGAAHQT